MDATAPVTSLTAFIDATGFSMNDLKLHPLATVRDTQFYMMSSALVSSIFNETDSMTIGRYKQRVTQYIAEKCSEGTDYIAVPFANLSEELRVVFEDVNAPTKPVVKQVANANKANVAKSLVVFIRGDILKAAVVVKNVVAKIMIDTMRTASILTAFVQLSDQSIYPVVKKSEFAMEQLASIAPDQKKKLPKSKKQDSVARDEKGESSSVGAPCFILIVSNDVVSVLDDHMALLVKTDLVALRTVAHNLAATLLPSFYAIDAFALTSSTSSEWNDVTAATIIQYLVAKNAVRIVPAGTTAMQSRVATLKTDMSSQMFMFTGDMTSGSSGRTARKLSKRVQGFLESFIQSSNVEVSDSCAASFFSSHQRLEHVLEFMEATYTFYDSHMYEKMPTAKNTDRKGWTERMNELPGVQDKALLESYAEYCDDVHLPPMLRLDEGTLFATLKHLGLHRCNDRYLLIRALTDDIRPHPEGMSPVAIDTVLKTLKDVKSKKNKFNPILLCDTDVRAKIVERLKTKRISVPKKRRSAASSSASSKKTRTLDSPQVPAEDADAEDDEEPALEL